MSVLQSQQKEVRYLKRKALEEESRIVGNALRDQIRQYGIDCTYYKLSTDGWTNFKNVIDENTRLKRAYGYDITPDYTLSASMITYADVQQDIFLLNKIGVNPNVEIDFNFDRIDFACALAEKCGQLKEYQIDKTEIVCEVPAIEDSYVEYNGTRQYLSSHIFPFEIGIGAVSPAYTCGILSGRFRALIQPYELGKECTIVCDPYEHTQFNVQFPTNSDLYRSLKYSIEHDDYLETLIYLTYRVDQVKTSNAKCVNMLSGYVHGSVLYYDIDQIGKYAELIHPNVGDIVEIDFPDDKNREKYEITECYDKQLTQDGINPLLHKYIWKCKGRRYINSFEDNTPQTEGDDRVEEMQRYDSLIDEQVAKEVSMYDELSNGITEDAAYGGMDGITRREEKDKDGMYSDKDANAFKSLDEYDKQVPDVKYCKYDFIDDGTAIDLIRFGVGSRLVTNGYDLIFMNADGEFFEIATNSIPLPSHHCMLEQGLRWLKATDAEVVFVNVEGESHALAVDIEATQGELELCLNSLFDKTLDTPQSLRDDDARLDALDNGPLNQNNQNFYKFKGTKTYLWSDGKHLYAKLASNRQLYQIDGYIDSEDTSE